MGATVQAELGAALGTNLRSVRAPTSEYRRRSAAVGGASHETRGSLTEAYSHLIRTFCSVCRAATLDLRT